MNNFKRTLAVGAGVATIGLSSLAGTALVSADTSTTSSTTGSSSLVDKIASRFGLEKSKVQAVFDEDHATHMAEMKEKRATALKQAVTDGKLTQAQADHITAAWAEIDKLRDAAGSPENETDAQRTAIKEKTNALRTWEDEQNINLQGIAGLGGPHGGHGPRGGENTSSATATN